MKLSELRNNLGTGSAFNVVGCTAAQTLVWSSLMDQFACQDISLPAGKVTGLAAVATSGSYNDLADKPTIPAAQVNADWNAASGAAQILNKPTLGSLAAKSAVNLSTADATGVLPVAKGGTNSSTALVNSRVMVSNAGAIVEHGTVTSTEVVYLDGVTSAIQTQLNSKASTSGWTNLSVIGVNSSGNLTAVPGSVDGSHLGWTSTGPAWTTARFPASTTANQLLYSSANNVVGGLATAANAVLTTNASGVPSWSVLSNDSFAQYALLAGRSGGQTLNGGTAASQNLTLNSTSNATKGFVLLNPTGGSVGIGTSSPAGRLDVVDSFYTNTGTLSVRDQGIANEGGQIDLLGQGANNHLIIDNLAGSMRLYSASAASNRQVQVFNVGTASTLGMYVQGSVGVGINNPRSSLDVLGGLRANPGAPANDSANVGYSFGGNGDTGMFLVNNTGSADGDIAFYSNASPKVTILGANGNMGIGSTNPQNQLQINGSQGILSVGANGWVDPGATGAGIVVDNNAYKALMIVGNNVAGNGGRGREIKMWDYLNVQGIINATNSMYAPAYYYTSDRRLKKNIRTISGALDKVQSLRGVNFDWKKSDQPDVGFVAQEVEEVLPELVNTSKDGNDQEVKTVKYGNIVAVVLQAVKELAALWNKDHQVLEAQKEEIAQIKQQNEFLLEQNKLLKEAICESNPNAKVCQ